MSDVDRLRAAADRLDEQVSTVRMKPWLAAYFYAEMWEKQAALLRAVADEGAPYIGPCPVETWHAAVALADTILGDNDEQA